MSCVRAAAVTAGAIGVLALAGCGGSSRSGSSVQRTPEGGTAFIGAVGGSTPAGSHATLVVENGVTAVDVTSGSSGTALVNASTPGGAMIPTLTRTADGVIHLQLSGGSGGGAAASVLSVTVSSEVVWSIELDGGASDVKVDMSHGRLASLDLNAGVTSADIHVPPPSGTMTVTENGGASRFAVTEPHGTPTKVTASGGAGSVQIGTTTHTGVAGSSVFTDPSYGSVRNRVDVELHGGVSAATVSR